MECVWLTKDIHLKKETAVALGFFDGIHLGHRKLIEKMKYRAKENNLMSTIVTFDCHPLCLTAPKHAPKLISSNEEKTSILKTFDIDLLVFLKFTEELMNLEPEVFVEEILVKRLKVKSVIVGFNYRFGHKGMGTPELLRELGLKYGFTVEIVSTVTVDDEVVSSTLIRNLIEAGDIRKIRKFLGRDYFVIGKVIKGKQIGHQYNVPTANIEVERNRIKPKTGVYYTQVEIKGNIYHGLTNVGKNPTFKNHPFRIETYLYNFCEDIYDETIKVSFVEKIRDEMKFSSVDDLFVQINCDIKKIRDKYVIKNISI